LTHPISSGANKIGLPKAGTRASEYGETLPWQQRERLPVKLAAAVSSLSVGSLYKAAHEGRLTFIRSEGRVLVVTQSLRELMGQAEPWKPQSDRGAAARARRAEAVRSSLR
jgi:hypothetical protein